MRAPAFWQAEGNRLAAWLLAPLGWLYGRITLARLAQPGEPVAIPVIAIGNFTAGGAGKTPVTRALSEALAARGERPFILSRGYGGSLRGPHRVEPSRDTAAMVGDEPLMLARQGPVIIARDRRAGARMALEQGASVLVLDDALHNPHLAKDFTLAVVDGGAGFGNGFCVPAGPLRAPVGPMLAQTDAVLMIGADRHDIAVELRGRPIFASAIAADPRIAEALRKKRVLAFCGIGRPEKFAETLREIGTEIVRLRAFPDHHAFTESEASALLSEAGKLGATPVTTEKDAMRLAGGPAREKLREAAMVLPISVPLPDELMAAIYRVVDSSRRRVSTASGLE
ncbi:MAG: tetraacyldisaccharide 4'-kinase [Methylobacterium sp.]|nr:tetraacyldisaccharide 4'-kinase [Methylobacterium sp.]MCA3605696.1 tetraacyldisaccharide 4'-kinase [Methylobacterium sp.]MCA3608338.1 tetraacyldisaccharide 4'-kinase [Methylobacterium sp.]MCA3617925.1 tetraacyldisaccharide 4'-kinase [Methylobacterium sp.]MCA3621134.1 tetraacyldisaccharide 4'-kinase [Methylobacterium sp.]